MKQRGTWQEDDAIAEVVQGLRRRNMRILAAGGNQAGLFRFHLPDGRRKAPDVVAVRDALIMVLEAKVQASALLRLVGSSRSDYECMAYLASTPDAQGEIIEEVRRTLATLGIELPGRPQLVAGVVASTDISRYEEFARWPELILLKVPKGGHLEVIRDYHEIL